VEWTVCMYVCGMCIEVYNAVCTVVWTVELMFGVGVDGEG